MLCGGDDWSSQPNGNINKKKRTRGRKRKIQPTCFLLSFDLKRENLDLLVSPVKNLGERLQRLVMCSHIQDLGFGCP